MFIIEDDFHAEYISEELGTFDSALSELHRISEIPFGNVPNRPPCANWRNCRRDYHIVEYDDSQVPWILLSNLKVLEISETGVKWYYPD